MCVLYVLYVLYVPYFLELEREASSAAPPCLRTSDAIAYSPVKYFVP